MKTYRKNENETTTQKSKKIVCLAPEHFEVLSGIIHDEAINKSTSDSNIMEQALLDIYMGPNSFAHPYIRNLYLKGVAFAIGGMVQDMSAGINYTAKNCTSSLELLYFISKMSTYSTPVLSGDEPMFNHFRTQCSYLLEIVQHETVGIELDIHQKTILKDFEILIQLLPADFVPSNYINFIKTFWDYLNNSTFTYRMLYGLVYLTGNEWLDTPETRIEARELIKKVTANWG